MPVGLVANAWCIWLLQLVKLDAVLPSSATSSTETASTSTGDFSLWWWRFWPESFDTFGTTGGDLTVSEVTSVEICVEIRVG